MAGYGGGAEGFTKFIADKVAQKAGIDPNAAKNEQARKMYEDAMANNALLQGMQDRWNARQEQRAAAPVASNPFVSSIANAALKNLSGESPTNYGVMAPQNGGSNSNVRGQYQGN